MWWDCGCSCPQWKKSSFKHYFIADRSAQIIWRSCSGNCIAETYWKNQSGDWRSAERGGGNIERYWCGRGYVRPGTCRGAACRSGRSKGDCLCGGASACRRASYRRAYFGKLYRASRIRTALFVPCCIRGAHSSCMCERLRKVWNTWKNKGWCGRRSLW